MHPCVALLRTTLRASWKPANYPENPQSLGEHLRRKRLDLGLLQTEAATQLGCHKATLRLWEKDKVEPERRQRSRIIKFLGYDPRTMPD